MQPVSVTLSSSGSSPWKLATASSTTAANQIAGLTSLAIAAYRLTLNALSSIGAKVVLATVQSGIG